MMKVRKKTVALLLSFLMIMTAFPATIFGTVFAAEDNLADLTASITAAQQKLDNPPQATGKNDPNAWMTNPIPLDLYRLGGASTAEVSDMEAKQYTTVGDVQEAIATAQALVDANSTDAEAIASAKVALDSAAERLKGIRVYDSFSGLDAYATNFSNGQQWFDSCGYLIQAHGGQVSYFDPAVITASYANVEKENPYPEDCWYWIGENRASGNGAFCLYSSKDLYNWNYRGVLLEKNLPADEDGVAKGIRISVYERPKLMYNAATGKFVLWAHIDSTTTSGGNSYAAAMAGSAINDTIDGIYTYQGRSRLHKLNEEQKMQYRWEQGYNYHKSYNSTPWNAGPFWFEMPSMRAFARDMNVFVDDDGTGYIIYSSEENRTLFISRLNASYTGLAVPDGEAVEGVDFVRINPGMMREGPSLFKYNGKYYIVTSGCNGWAPNTNTIMMADEIFGYWENLGDIYALEEGEDINVYPEAGTSRLSYGSQSTSAIPVNPEKGQYILMADRWGGGGSRTSGYMWLPITFKPSGDGAVVYGVSNWTLEDLASINRMRITSELSSYYLDTRTLPSELDIEVLNDEGEWVAYEDAMVIWDVAGNQAIINSLPVMGNAEIKGVVMAGDEEYGFSVNYLKVNSSARYLIDVGYEWAEGSDLFDNDAYMAKIRQLAPNLKNSVADQPFASATEENPFGYTSTIIGNAFNATALYPAPTSSVKYDDTGFYVNYQGEPWSTIAYKMFIDENGQYTVSLGVNDWWGPVKRDFVIRTSYVDQYGSNIIQESEQMSNINKANYTFAFPVKNLPAGGGDLSVEVVFLGQSTGPEGDKQENGIMANWLALSFDASKVDYSALSNLYDVVKYIVKDGQENWAAFSAARSEAVALLSLLSPETTQEDIDAAEKALRTELIKIGAKPDVDPQTLANGQQGEAYKDNLTARDSFGYPYVAYSITDGALPEGLSLDGATGKITGTPIGATGIYTFTVTVTDSQGTDSAEVTIEIVSSVPPTITNDSVLPDATQYQRYAPSSNRARLQVANKNTPVTFSLKEGSSLPAGMTLTRNNNYRAVIGGTPTEYGTFNFIIVTTDKYGTKAEKEFTLNVIFVPVDATINPTSADADKFSTEGVSVTKDDGSYSLTAIRNGETALVEGTDYTISENVVTISRSYLLAQAVGNTTLTFDYDDGADPTLSINITDTSAEKLASAIEAAQEKLDNPPEATGKNDPNAWMTNPINQDLYNLGGATRADVTDMEEKNYTTVGDVEAAIAAAEALAESGDADAIAQAVKTLESVTERLKAIRVYDAFSGVDAYNTSFNPEGQIWYDTCGYRIQASCGQVSYFDPAVIAASYEKAGKENPYPNDCWYWVGEDRSNGATPQAAFSLYSSSDLYNWNYRGVVMQKNLPVDETGIAAGISIRVYERPKILYNEKNGNFVLWAHIDSTTVNGGNNYAAATAGVAVNSTIDGLYDYQGRSRLHQLNEEQSAQYKWEQGYNYHRSYNRAPWNAGPYWYEMPSMRGFARDMNVFVDDDGTGYIVYASEENRTVFISRLNDDFTGLAVPNGEAVEGVDFARLNPGAMREGLGLFKYNGKYYIFSSGCTGTKHNTNTAWVADEIFGEWEDLGNVCVLQPDEDPTQYPSNLDSRLTFGTQSGTVFPVDAEKGQFIWMCDRWGGSAMGIVWLPVTFKAAGGVEVDKYSYWTLEDLASINKMRVTSELPDYYLMLSKLPTTLDVEVLNDEGNWEAVSGAQVIWNDVENQAIVDAMPMMSNTELTGTVAVGNARYEVRVKFLKVNYTARYLIDVGAEYVDGSNIFGNEDIVSQINRLAPDLKNKVADQAFAEANVQNPFGYTSTIIGTDYNSSALYIVPTTSKTYDNSGFYVNYQGEPWAPVAYKMFVNEEGSYTISMGSNDRWSPTRRFFKIRATYTDKDQETVVQESEEMWSISKADYTYDIQITNLPSDGTDLLVEFIFLRQDLGPEGDKKENGLNVNWIALAYNDAEETQVITAVLEYLIAVAEGMKEDGSLENTLPIVIGLFEEALANGKEVLDNYPTQEEVDEAAEYLLEMITLADWKVADKSALERLVEEAEALDLDEYISIGKEELAEAIEAAKEVLDDENAMQEDADEALQNLLDAIAGLTKKADKTLLTKAIELAGKLDLSKYVEAGQAEFQAAYAAAQAVMENEDALQSEVDEAYENLMDAMDALRLKLNKDKLAELLAKAQAKNEVSEELEEAMVKASILLSDETLDEEDQDTVDEAAGDLEAALEGEDDENTEEPDDDAPVDTGSAAPYAMMAMLAVSAAGIFLLKKRNR